MNWYPTMYHPITNQPVNLFSDAVNLLLETYTEQDLLKRPRVTHTTIFTNISDMDYQIMIYLDINQLKALCCVNRYVYLLAQNKQFWINKFNHDHLLLPSLLQQKWISNYHILHWITKYINNIDDYSIDITDNDGITELFKKYIVRDINIKEIIIWFDKGNYLMATYPINNSVALLTKQTLINYLYEAMINNLVKITLK